MVRRTNECAVKVNENMRGGDGSVKLTSLISGPEELLDKGRLFSVITLEPGCSIGCHVHEKESELFYIMKGCATYNDNGEEITVYPGDFNMSMDLNFWKYKGGVTHDHNRIYEQACCDGKAVEELESLPIDEIYNKIASVFSDLTVMVCRKPI